MKTPRIAIARTVLVVDDEADLREAVGMVLEWDGLKVLKASNGAEALAIARAQQPDAILTDVRMPGGDGLGLLEKIRALDPRRPPVFLITGYADLTVRDALGLGAEGVFTKPFDSDDMLASIHAAIAGDRKRWAKPTMGSGTKNELGESSASMFELKDSNALFYPIVWGQGGACFRIPPAWFPQLRKATVPSTVQFDLTFVDKPGHSFCGRGILRWLDFNNAVPQCGIEWQVLDPATHEWFLQLRAQNPSPAFVPSRLAPTERRL